jgi:tRNA(fMet)-specific endonuclease VapC
MMQSKGDKFLYLLDTNTISARMRRDEKVVAKLNETIIARKAISMSGVSHYEIKRGLLAVNATRKMQIYEEIRKDLQMLFLDSEEVFDKAAKIHADLKRRGEPIPEADIFIAAIALHHDLILVTDDSHFDRIADLMTENWIRD